MAVPDISAARHGLESLREGDEISVHAESLRGSVNFRATVSSVGRHHVKIMSRFGSAPAELVPGDLLRIRIAKQPHSLPLTSRLIRQDRDDPRKCILALPAGSLLVNRRAFVRTDTQLECALIRLDGFHSSGNTVNVSGGGALLDIGVFATRGEKLLVYLDLPRSYGGSVMLRASTIRHEEIEDISRIALQFIDIPSRTQNHICRLVMSVERENRKRLLRGWVGEHL